MATRGNVVALPAHDLGGLELAATSFPGNLLTGSRSELWLCPAYDSQQRSLMLYVKVGLTTRALMAEALGATLARCLGLHTPEAYLVTVQPRHVRRQGGHALLGFGSREVASAAMAQPVRDLRRLLAILQARKMADLACVFDEWIANEVRSPSDILVAPQGEVYLIDHEGAFPAGLAPDASATNWLAARLIEALTDDERPRFLRQLRGRLAALHRVNLGDAPGTAGFASDGVVTYRLLLQFLQDRLSHLDRLLSERVLPQQLYLNTSPRDP